MLTRTRKKLIIWDFDGVIADTEVIWQKIRLKKLKERFDINWSLFEANRIIGGMSDATKISVLQKLGYQTTPEFWEEVHRIDREAMDKGFNLTPHIEEIFEDSQFKQCIATGDGIKNTLNKCKVTGADKWFKPEQIFSAEMVKHGKPEPDLFRLAANKMGFTPGECVVIEDSTAGLTAALNAHMTPIAYAGSTMNRYPEFTEKVKMLGISYISDDMREIHKIIKGIQ